MIRVPYTFRTAGQRTPLNRLDQNFFALADWIDGRVPAIGPLASRPPAGQAGALYVASDQGYEWYLDDGATWQPVGGLGQGALLLDGETQNLQLFGAGLGTDGRRVLTGLLGTPPTTTPADTAQLYVADKLGLNGQASWTTHRESGSIRPVDPILVRLVGDTTGFFTLGTVGETAVGSGWTVPANTLLGRALEVAVRFDVANTSGVARTLTLRVKLGPGPTTLATAAFAFPIGATAQGLWAVQIDTLDATHQRAAHTYTPCYPVPTSVTLTTVDGTLDVATALQLVVTAQWSAGSATVNVSTLTIRLL